MAFIWDHIRWRCTAALSFQASLSLSVSHRLTQRDTHTHTRTDMHVCSRHTGEHMHAVRLHTQPDRQILITHLFMHRHVLIKKKHTHTHTYTHTLSVKSGLQRHASSLRAHATFIHSKSQRKPHTKCCVLIHIACESPSAVMLPNVCHVCKMAITERASTQLKARAGMTKGI